jgi:hypothetical protein
MSVHRNYPGDITITYDEPIKKVKLKKDKYVQSVKDKFEERSQTGIKKYNTTLEREDLNFLDWINHLQEELMDATLYLERLKTSYAEETTKSSKTSTGELH